MMPLLSLLVFIEDITFDLDALHQLLPELAQHRAQESSSWLFHTNTVCISGVVFCLLQKFLQALEVESLQVCLMCPGS